MVSPEDGERVSIVLPLIPVRVGIIVAVKELVPYNEEFFRSWRERVMSHHEDLGELGALEVDLQRAVVMLKDPETGEKHKFLAIPVQQTDVLDIRHATSSAHPSFLCMGMLLIHEHPALSCSIPGDTELLLASSVVE